MTRSDHAGTGPLPLRRWHETAWSVGAGTFLAVGQTAAFVVLGPLACIGGLLLGTLVLGAVFFTFIGEDTASFLRGQRWAFVTMLVGLTTVGLVQVVDGWAYPAAAVVVLGCPAATRQAGPLLRKARWVPPAAPEPTPPCAPFAVTGPVPAPTVDMAHFELSLLETEAADAGPDPDRHAGVLSEPASASLPDAAQGPLSGAASSLHDLTLEELVRLWRRSYVLLQQDLPPRTALQVLTARDRCLQEFERRSPAGVRAWLASGDTATTDPRRFLVDADNDGGTAPR